MSTRIRQLGTCRGRPAVPDIDLISDPESAVLYYQLQQSLKPGLLTLGAGEA